MKLPDDHFLKKYEDGFKRADRALRYLYLFRKSLILLFGQAYYEENYKIQLDKIQNKIERRKIIA